LEALRISRVRRRIVDLWPDDAPTKSTAPKPQPNACVT
jgi:hypothetical protein